MRDVICNEVVPFRPCCGGVVTRTRNVSEYMLVLALCLVEFCICIQLLQVKVKGGTVLMHSLHTASRRVRGTDA